MRKIIFREGVRKIDPTKLKEPDLNIIASKITRMNLDLYFFKRELEWLQRAIKEQECRIFDLKITIEMKRGEFTTV